MFLSPGCGNGARTMSRKYLTINFRASGCSEASHLVHEVLSHYSNMPRATSVVSGLIDRAYKQYYPSEPEFVTAMIDFRTTAQSFVRLFEIKTRDDIYDVIENAVSTTNAELKEPGSIKISVFDEADPKALINVLKTVAYKSRSSIISKIVFQYLARGTDDFYNTLSANRLLEWLQDEYAHADVIGYEKLETVIDQICFNARDIAKELDPVKAEDTTTSDYLRAVIGV